MKPRHLIIVAGVLLALYYFRPRNSNGEPVGPILGGIVS